jgi:hypothetical protein
MSRKTAKEAPLKLMIDTLMFEGWILFDESFHEMNRTAKLDLLQDFINALQEEYDEVHEEEDF